MMHMMGKITEQKNDTAMMLGNFDGLHIGHQKLLDTLKVYAHEGCLETVVFSFFPHPNTFFGKKEFQTIYSSDERAFLLAEMGVDVFVEYPFDQSFADCSSEAFVKDLLVKQMKCKAIVVGEGYRFGRGRTGNVDVLQEIGLKYGIKIIVLPLVQHNGVKISSSFIREDIREVRFKQAQALLTRPYFVSGKVVSGRKLGRAIGFPTANLLADPHKLLPPDGVYATETSYNGKTYKSLTNIGLNPTVSEFSERTVETFMLGFDQDIYGETIQVNFFKWLRGEMAFNSLDALKQQITKDVHEGLI